MKIKVFFLPITFLLFLSCNQNEDSKVTLRSDIIHEYHKIEGDDSFCEGMSYLLMEGDTIPVLTERDFIKDILEKHPKFQKDLGKPEEYSTDPFQRVDYDNLKSSLYNKFHYSEEGTYVSSESFFNSTLNSNITYSTYNVEGVFVKFKNLKKYLDDITSAPPEGDCLCKWKKIKEDSDEFYVIYKVKSISERKIDNTLKRKMYSSKLDIFYCE